MKLLIEIPELEEHNLALTMDEAEKLYIALDKIFGKKEFKLTYPDGVRTPYPPENPFIKRNDKTNPFDDNIRWNGGR